MPRRTPRFPESASDRFAFDRGVVARLPRTVVTGVGRGLLWLVLTGAFASVEMLVAATELGQRTARRLGGAHHSQADDKAPIGRAPRVS